MAGKLSDTETGMKATISAAHNGRAIVKACSKVVTECVSTIMLNAEAN